MCRLSPARPPSRTARSSFGRPIPSPRRPLSCRLHAAKRRGDRKDLRRSGAARHSLGTRRTRVSVGGRASQQSAAALHLFLRADEPRRGRAAHSRARRRRQGPARRVSSRPGAVGSEQPAADDDVRSGAHQARPDVEPGDGAADRGRQALHAADRSRLARRQRRRDGGAVQESVPRRTGGPAASGSEDVEDRGARGRHACRTRGQLRATDELHAPAADAEGLGRSR